MLFSGIGDGDKGGWKCDFYFKNKFWIMVINFCPFGIFIFQWSFFLCLISGAAGSVVRFYLEQNMCQ